MSIVTIIIPLGAFALAVFWMIHQGNKAKKEYLRRREVEHQNKASADVEIKAGAEKLGQQLLEAKAGDAADATQGHHQGGTTGAFGHV